MELKDKTALITGAATGIGRSLAVALAREGADVALLDIDEKNALVTAEMVRKEGRRAEFYAVDVSRRDSVESAVDAAWTTHGPIALACANAGVLAMKPLLEMEPGDVEWVLRVNLLGVLDTVRAYVSRVRAAGKGGHLLLTGSENSVAIPHGLRRAGLGFYGITKHGVLHMGDTLRYELAADGIGVSVLMPGPVRTEISTSGRNRSAEFGGKCEPPDFDSSVIDWSVPLAPLIEPDAAARIAIEGLKAGRFMIPTHSHILEYAQARVDELAAANRDSKFEPES
ncbi:MAG: SDR family NAD(P)-dependent oxidoreductase [Candidatus Binatia bacterium]